MPDVQHARSIFTMSMIVSFYSRFTFKSRLMNDEDRMTQ